jgi:transposase
LKRQGLGVSAIARQTGLDRKTVRIYLDRVLEAPVYGPTEPGDRLADRFQSYLAQRLEAFPGLSARRLHREIKAMGYGGAYSTLTEYLRLIRPAVPRRFERRFETPAGKQAQVDFAEFQVEFASEPGVMRKVWLFSMALGRSRRLWGGFARTRRWKR